MRPPAAAFWRPLDFGSPDPDLPARTLQPPIGAKLALAPMRIARAAIIAAACSKVLMPVEVLTKSAPAAWASGDLPRLIEQTNTAPGAALPTGSCNVPFQ